MQIEVMRPLLGGCFTFYEVISGSFFCIYNDEKKIADVCGGWKTVSGQTVFCMDKIMQRKGVFKFVAHPPMIKKSLENQLNCLVDISQVAVSSSCSREKQD